MDSGPRILHHYGWVYPPRYARDSSSNPAIKGARGTIQCGKGPVSWPPITEEEIQDRSKGDYLLKGRVVLVQTSWFITQCIVRGAYRLEITELEVVTLAFAAHRSHLLSVVAQTS